MAEIDPDEIDPGKIDPGKIDPDKLAKSAFVLTMMMTIACVASVAIFIL